MNIHDKEAGLDPALIALDDRLQAVGGEDLNASVAASWRQVREHVHERQRLRPTPWRHRLAVALAVAAPVAILAAFAIVSLGGPRPTGVALAPGDVGPERLGNGRSDRSRSPFQRWGAHMVRYQRGQVRPRDVPRRSARLGREL